MLSFRETGEQQFQKPPLSVGRALPRGAPAREAAVAGLVACRSNPDPCATGARERTDRVRAHRSSSIARAVEGESRAARIDAARGRIAGVERIVVHVEEGEHELRLWLWADRLAVLAENVLLLQQLAYRGRLHRVLSVLKMRFSDHEYTLREFLITSPKGIRVLTPDESGREVLVGLTEQQPGGAEKGESTP